MYINEKVDIIMQNLQSVIGEVEPDKVDDCRMAVVNGLAEIYAKSRAEQRAFKEWKQEKEREEFQAFISKKGAQHGGTGINS